MSNRTESLFGSIKSNYSWFNYLIMYFCVALCGVPFFYGPKIFKVIFASFLIIIFVIQKRKIDRAFIGVNVFIVIIFIIQVLKFGSGNLINFGYIFLIITIPYLSLKIVGRDFMKYYINIIYFFAVISLIFYAISTFSPAFYNWTSTLPTQYHLDPNPELKKGFIIYTWEPAQLQGFLRNPGPFWEPSVYSNYLILALVFNIINTGVLAEKKNFVFIAAMITTLSTGGYVALFILLFSYSTFVPKIHFGYRLILIPFLVLTIYVSYSEFVFLGSKIEAQWEHQTSVEAEGTQTSGRFMGAKKSLIAFSRHPIAGRGLIRQTAAERTDDEGGAYGFISVLRRTGLFGFIVWIIFIYRYPARSAVLNGLPGKLGIGFFLAMMATNFGQAGYDKPLYLMVFYSGLLGYVFVSDRHLRYLNRNEDLVSDAIKQHFFPRSKNFVRDL